MTKWKTLAVVFLLAFCASSWAQEEPSPESGSGQAVAFTTSEPASSEAKELWSMLDNLSAQLLSESLALSEDSKAQKERLERLSAQLTKLSDELKASLMEVSELRLSLEESRRALERLGESLTKAKAEALAADRREKALIIAAVLGLGAGLGGLLAAASK